MNVAVGTQRDFESLSLQDLLEARDLYHWHLINRGTVVGTAIGLYLIRKNDPWPTRKRTAREQIVGNGKRPRKPPRTFANSEVRDYSWPCVLVLVSEWLDDSEFVGGDRGAHHPREMLPKTLYMPDGRKVPVCVVKVDATSASATEIPTWHWPAARIGPGYPIAVSAQGRERRASIGCLVTDGHTTYALTNRHVSGAAGEEIYSYVGGQRVRVGRASEKQATRVAFSDAYPDFPGRRTFVNLDVGLVEIDDLTSWTSRVYGIGPVGELADLHEANLRLDLINAEVIAHGAASGPLSGKIKALFYRYKSVGGFDYVTDFLIAPSSFDHQTQPGDSGTVWHILPRNGKKDAPPEPLAVEWGAQALQEAGVSPALHFTLATSLASICRQLDVELVRTSSTGARPYWGQVGHYSIGTFACNALRGDKVTKLMTANKDRISFVEEGLDPKNIREAMKRAKDDEFVPLADVPDIVWKRTPYQVAGGRDRPAGKGRTTGPEHPTHYADIDEPRDSDGKTLLDLCLADPRKLDVDFWRAFYDEQGHTKSKERGLLPFRVWQIFDEMVDSVQKGRVDRFVCAAGILSHYVGDACQPLHGSMYADGYADQEMYVTKKHRDGTTTEEKSHVGAGVHSAYETSMIDRYAGEIVDGLTRLSEGKAKLVEVKDGHDAGMETIRLMSRSARRIPPRKVVDTFVDAGGTKTVAVYDALWNELGKDTIAVMWDGAQVLASIWEGAWKAGGGSAIKATDLKPRSLARLKAIYENSKFVPSVDLDEIASLLR